MNHDNDSRYRFLRSGCLADAENSSQRSLACFWHGKAVYYPIQEIAWSLDPQKSQTLPVFHVFTSVTLCPSLLEKGKRMRGTRRMCFLTLPTHSWKSLVHPVSYRMSVQETLKELTRFGNNCSVRILVTWIEFLQPLQL